MKRLLPLAALVASLLLCGCAPSRADAEAMILKRFPGAELIYYEGGPTAEVIRYMVRAPNGTVYCVTIRSNGRIDPVEIFPARP